MLDGETATLKIIKMSQAVPNLPPTLVLPTAVMNDCCGDFSFKALANPNSTEDTQNDRQEFYFYFGNSVTSAVMYLQRWNGSAFADVATLNTSTYGTFKPFAFFTNRYNKIFISYLLNWKSVLVAFNEGSYRVRCVYNGGAGEVFSREYCLKTYTAERANGTIRLEYNLNGTWGDVNNDYSIRDFGTENIFQQYRLKGFFNFTKSTKEETKIQYENGEQKEVSSLQTPEYNLFLERQAWFVHQIIQADVFQNEKLKITDYNADNFGSFTEKYVFVDSEFAPDFLLLQDKLAPLTLQLKQWVNNFKKYR